MKRSVAVLIGGSLGIAQVIGAGAGMALVRGPLLPGLCIDSPLIGSQAWSAPERAAASDDFRATKSLAFEATHFLVCTGFDLGLPEDAIIHGIVVDNEVSVGGFDERIEDHAQRLVSGGSIGTADRASSQPWPLTDSTIAHGASDDLWEACWCARPPGFSCLDPTCGNVNAPGFGTALAARHTSGSSGRARVDATWITIHYEPAPPSPTATATWTPTSTPTRTATPTRTPTPTVTATFAICPPRPRGECTEPGKSKIKLAGITSPLTRSLSWKWTRGTVAAERFGDPRAETTYAVCLYSDEQLVSGLLVQPGGSCGKDDCWKSARGQGFVYRNRDTNLHGIKSVSLRAGAGTARIEINARRDNLNVPMPLHPRERLTIQLIQTLGTGSQCWGSGFPSPPVESTLDGFEDRIPSP